MPPTRFFDFERPTRPALVTRGVGTTCRVGRSPLLRGDGVSLPTGTSSPSLCPGSLMWLFRRVHMSQPTDEQRADEIRRIYEDFDALERCTRRIASDSDRSELTDLILVLRNRITRMLCETESTDKKERSSSCEQGTADGPFAASVTRPKSVPPNVSADPGGT